MAASARAEAVVTRRQLLPPNPSVKPSVIFFGPHHDGTADVLADELPAMTSTTPQRSANARSAAPLRWFVIRVLPFSWSDLSKRGLNDRSGRRDARRTTHPEAPCDRSPIDGVERDSHGERPGLDERPRRERHAESEHDLVELGQEESGDRRRDEVAATAEQRRAAEHDRRDRRQEIVVALVGRRLIDDPGVEHRREAVEDLGADVRSGAMASHADRAVRAALALAPTPSNRRPAGVSFTTAVTTAVVTTATYTGVGIPSQIPPPTLARRAVVVRGMPPVYQNTTPKSNALCRASRRSG